MFIAIGSVEYEGRKILGVLPSFDDAAVRCVSHGWADNFDSYHIEEWPLLAREPSNQWMRDLDGDNLWHHYGEITS
jgi:hypothetical protein